MEQEQTAELFDQAEARIEEFRKETYEASFQRYLEDNVPVWEWMSAAETGDLLLQEQERRRVQIADRLTACARAKVDALKGRGKKERLQYTLNLYMVSYVLPAVMAWQRRCGIREEETRRLTDVICSSWQSCFGTRIQASGQEAIQAGFRQKLCFVTTAVCRGLLRPQDCKEIRLMKQFRDGYFSESAEGRRLIREYYDIAPTIVKRIAREADPEEKYLYLWNTYIRKCVDCIEHGQNEQCGRLYTDMMSSLREEYMVTDRRVREQVKSTDRKGVSLQR